MTPDEQLTLRQALHDLQQPLNVIRLASGNLRLRFDGRLGPEEETYLGAKLDRIDEQVIRAARQIEELRAAVIRGE